MSEYHGNSSKQIPKGLLGVQSLDGEETSQLILACSLSATKPLLGLIKFLIEEGILDADRFRLFLKPMLAAEQFPPTARAMLDPIWKSFLEQVEA